MDQKNINQLFQRYILVAITVWLVIVAAFLAWDIYGYREQSDQLAYSVADAYLKKDMAFRLWGNSHGGVYVPVSESTRPNPYLAHVPERDITTPAGRQLTLMNPAYMVREMLEKFSTLTGVSGHLTSLKLLNPINKPDSWERQHLADLETGVREVREVTEVDGQPHLRLMRPFITKKGCLKCHGVQGYKVGDVRGAVSLSLPMTPYYAVTKAAVRKGIVSHLVIFLIGAMGIYWSGSRIHKNVLRRQHAEAEIIRQHEMISNILESLTESFYVIDATTYAVVMANSAAAPDGLAAGTTCYSLGHAVEQPCDGRDHPCPLKMVVESGKAVTVRHEHVNANGENRLVDVHCYPVFDGQGQVRQIIEYNNDVTEQVRMAEQLHRTQRLESVGRLAGGVAHDFNNLLSAILGYCELALLQLQPEHPVCDKIRTIESAGQKAAVLTRQLLAFSRRQVLNIELVDLKQVVDDMSQLLSRTIGENVRLDVLSEEGTHTVRGDRGQLEQIVMNLVVNARDAMPDGGRLQMVLGHSRGVPGRKVDAGSDSGGEYVTLEVIDNGSGMSEETKRQIFEPFFTTKEPGKGTGLGLATVYGIVKQHKGHIQVFSELGQGTRFVLYLPASHGRMKQGVVEQVKRLRQGTEAILAVDDDAAIRELVVATLEPLGYAVTVVASGEEAVALVDRQEQPFDLLLTDVILPGINGLETAEQVQERLPKIRVAFMSGYDGEILARRQEVGEDIQFLGKPLSPSALSAFLCKVFDGS